MVGVDDDPFFPQAFDLMGEVGEVDDHAVSHDAGDFRTQDTGREQVQDEFPPFVDNGVARVVAALVTADNIIFPGDQVDHAAFAFVSPVDAGDCS